MCKHTAGASAPTIDHIHRALLGERPEQMKAAELADLIAPNWDAAAAKEGDQ